VSSLLLKGIALGFAIAAAPGPIFVLCARRSLVQGRLYGVASGLGVATADGLHAAIATFGVAALAMAFDAGRRPLAVVGGAALVAIGVRILVARAAPPAATPRTSGAGLAWAYGSTLALTVANPATIVSFVALAATLGLGTGGSLARPLMVVAGVVMGSAAWWTLLAVGASILSVRITPPVLRAVTTVSGLAIMLLGMIAVIAALG
jgi:threonine/homoserine/homoserine lactone efflux protein